ncbi:hypothetical protein XENOCAPTIV_010417, partial [Xenoophorus captivus]
CHVCGFHTELNAQFVSHMSRHVDKEQWMFSLCCSVCDYVCMEESDMKSHISTGHAGLNSRSPLSETKSTSSSLSALSDSLNSSEGGDVVHSNEELKNLLAPPTSAGSQASSGSFECVFCNFVCKTRSMYERHLQIHLITRMFECDVCHKFLKTPEQLLEHKKCHTLSSASVCRVLPLSSPLVALTRCPFCIYSTNRPAAMECHLKTHCKMEYRCRICQGLWPDQASLEAHMRGHRLGNHYKCEQCGYLSKTANKLIEHVRVHTGERPFHCDRCSYSCKRKDNLNLHKKLKHAPRQTFGCQECPFTTTHPFVFSRHLKKHQSGGAGGQRSSSILFSKGFTYSLRLCCLGFITAADSHGGAMQRFERVELPLVCQKCNPAVTSCNPALRGKLLRQKCVSVGAPSCLASLYNMYLSLSFCFCSIFYCTSYPSILSPFLTLLVCKLNACFT